MKKKIVWLVVSCLMALSLLMASCAPAVTEEEEKVVPPEKEEVAVEEEVVRPPKGPIYGGEIKQLWGKAGGTLDPGYGGRASDSLVLTNETLLTGDWAKGLAGTGEYSFIQTPYMLESRANLLTESWEMPDNETLVFHIRQGVHFHNKPPVNGREMTADDVAYSLKRGMEMPFGKLTTGYVQGDLISAEATDKWTVVVKGRPDMVKTQLGSVTEGAWIFPADGAGEYPGDYREWEVSCGTGPFMIVDHVPYSATVMVRNPDYWRKDPVHPENTLPYVDGVVGLFIEDKSTQRAAFRTGKIDNVGADWETAPILIETYPEAKWRSSPHLGGKVIAMRVDKPELPFYDIEVRRALAMGIDNQEIKDQFYGGDAEMLCWPVFNIPAFSDVYTPLDELPEEVRELYEYHPDKARELLAEAGYPDGFKTLMLCDESAASVDMLSLIKDYWAKIGVDLELKVRSGDAIKGLISDKKHEAMVWRGVAALSNPYRLAETASWSNWNLSMVNDPYIDEVYYQIQKTRFEPECHPLLKEYALYTLEKCWYIQPPFPRAFNFWQPWLMDYHGEAGIGSDKRYNWAMYVWVDQELKKEITGQ